MQKGASPAILVLAAQRPEHRSRSNAATASCRHPSDELRHGVPAPSRPTAIPAGRRRQSRAESSRKLWETTILPTPSRDPASNTPGPTPGKLQSHTQGKGQRATRARPTASTGRSPSPLSNGIERIPREAATLHLATQNPASATQSPTPGKPQSRTQGKGQRAARTQPTPAIAKAPSNPQRRPSPRHSSPGATRHPGHRSSAQHPSPVRTMMRNPVEVARSADPGQGGKAPRACTHRKAVQCRGSREEKASSTEGRSTAHGR